MRWAGHGSDLWRVRVDLFVEHAHPRPARLVQRDIAGRLNELLTGDDGGSTSGIDGDEETGVADRPVIGLLFWVRADDVGTAATTAVEIARRDLALQSGRNR